jgi:acetylornithine deacetylase/succinyl-diaminopimelate desuccinylase-like protein
VAVTIGRFGGMRRGEQTGALRAVWDRIDTDFDDHLERVRAYLRQPSVASTGEGLDAGAAMTASLIEAAGGEAEVVDTPGSPVVLGAIEEGERSLLRYGMYDVQPADEVGWTSPPFAAEIHDLPDVGPSIVARGAANSKSCFAAFCLGLASLRKVADIPVSLRFIVDGEEELGSLHLKEVMESNRDRLDADAAFDLDLSSELSGESPVYLGCKGIVSFNLFCRGGEWGGPVDRAMHSSAGVLVASPAWSIVRALGALVGPDESPRLTTLTTPSLSDEESALLDELAEHFDVDEYLSDSSVSRLKRDGDARELVEALLYGPVINVNGFDAGYAEGGKTIVPEVARAAVDIRTPRGTDTAAVTEEAVALIRAVAPEVTVEPYEVCPPAHTPADSLVAQAMIASHRDAGAAVAVWPTAPWWAPYYLFDQVLGLDFASGGVGHSGRAHATDEYASIEGIRRHMYQSVAFLYRYAAGAA